MNNISKIMKVRKFHTKYGRKSVLTLSIVKRLIEKFGKIEFVGDYKHTGRPNTSRSNDNIAAVHESVGDNSGTSIPCRIANF